MTGPDATAALMTAAGSPDTCPAAQAPAATRIGRPRDVRLDVAIRDATLALLAEGGYDALTMEAVASTAGVAKATLYRRYPGKEQLVVEAVASLSEPAGPLEAAGLSGSVRDELVAMLSHATRSAHSLAGKIFPRLVGASVDNPELMDRYRAQVIRPRRDRYAVVLRRGVEEGTLRADMDVEHAIDLLVGPLVYRSMHSSKPLPSDLAARIVDDVLAGLLPR